MAKAFENTRHNIIHLWFPNGNGLSTIWGVGTYSDNYDIDMKGGNFTDMYSTFLGSDTAEIMILNAPEKLKLKIEKKFDSVGNGVIGRLTIKDWLYVVKELSK
ncbi:MAG: hypothetical protein WC803_12805 [Sphingomonas sp.]|jgi:hypothetical protein